MPVDEEIAGIQSWVRSMLPRVVAVVAPFIAAGIAAATFWLQDVIGVDLQQYNGAAAAFVGIVLLGALGLAATWLFNAGQGQIALAKKALDVVVAEGKSIDEIAASTPTGAGEVPEEPPVVPPGLGGG